MKICSKCKNKRPISHFCKNTQQTSGLSPQCKECRTNQKRKWSKLNPKAYYKRNRSYQLRRSFGIDTAEYNKMFEEQSGKCAICLRHRDVFKRSLSVDHCHKTGKIRGLLCGPCNRAIGYLSDCHDIIDRAKKYLI